jgi:hypothetical protein
LPGQPVCRSSRFAGQPVCRGSRFSGATDFPIQRFPFSLSRSAFPGQPNINPKPVHNLNLSPENHFPVFNDNLKP